MTLDMNTSSKVRLLELPGEILHSVFKECEPQDLASLQLSCGTLNAYIAKNKLLCKEVYLRHYDEPPAEHINELDWERELHEVVMLQKLLGSLDPEVKKTHLRTIYFSIIRMLQTSAKPAHSDRNPKPRNVVILLNAFNSQINIDTLLCRSTLFARAWPDLQTAIANDPETRRLSAKLHVLYGVPIKSAGSHRRPTHTFARANVYDLRNYTDESFWGPFVSDGSARVDWEKMESIAELICYNLRKFHDKTNKAFPLLWHRPFAGVAPKSFLSPPQKVPKEQPLGDLDQRDPYRVSGTYMRVVCFLDYNDLFAYNFTTSPPEGQPRPPLPTEEAIRLITMQLRVTKIEPPGPDQGQALPVVHFEGTSKSMHSGWDPNANARIRGTVSLTTEGEVRWTTFSVFHGEERWRSEGIQVGGIQSARGVWGNWFDKDYDPEGPAGPTAFWKLTDEVPGPSPPSDTATSLQSIAAHSATIDVASALLHGRDENSASAANLFMGVGVTNMPHPQHAALHPYLQSVDSDDEEGGPGLEVGGAASDT